MRTFLAAFVGISGVGLGISPVRAASLYHVTDLGALPGDLSESGGLGINAIGQVVGYSEAATGTRSFLWTPNTPNGTSGSMIDLGDLPGGFDFGLGRGINDLGQVAGYSHASTGYRGSLWNPTTPNATTGSMTNLGTLPNGSTDSSLGYGINASGQVIGYSQAATGTRPFLWTPSRRMAAAGSMIDLGDLPGGGDASYGSGINASGQVVGYSQSATGNRGFLWSPTTPNGASGSMVDLGDLPGGNNSSFAYGINASGQVTGVGFAATGEHAFLWTPGRDQRRHRCDARPGRFARRRR